MTTFDNREAGYEAKFAHEQDMLFKATVRRNKMIGQWAADKLGISGDDAEHYAKEIVRHSLKKTDDDDVVHKIQRDFSDNFIYWSEHRIRAKLSSFMSAALNEVSAGA
nr:DUF1476 domain-containing protein [uncultured Cohaesibacter sp.]